MDLPIALWGLFASSFLSATLLPGTSEVALLAFLSHYPQQGLAAFSLATLGNTLGGMSTYYLARQLPDPAARANPRIERMLRRYGSVVLVLAWLPLAGDALAAAAGWLRLSWLGCLLWMTLGKATRYLFILWGAVYWI